jgi:chromosome segregation ATPase
MGKTKRVRKRAMKHALTALEMRHAEARERRRTARRQAKEAHKLLKEAKKVAKRAKAELHRLSKKLKKLLTQAGAESRRVPRNGAVRRRKTH